MSCCTRPLIGTVLTILLAGTPEVWAVSAESGTPLPVDPAVSTQQAVTTIAQKNQQQTRAAAADDEKLPDSPGAVLAQQTGDAAPQNEPGAQSQTQTPSQPSAPTQQNGAPQQSAPPASNPASQNTPQQPVGGAAAQLGRTTGGAASKPAGAALAPAKQRQTRSLLLKLGVIAGAGIAVGSVVALSKASPSRPPGAH